jgi:hypothetical protein
MDGGTAMIPPSLPVPGASGLHSVDNDAHQPINLSSSFHRRHQHHRHSSSLAFVPEDGIVSGQDGGIDLTPVSSATFSKTIPRTVKEVNEEEGEEEVQEEVEEEEAGLSVKLMPGQSRAMKIERGPLAAVSSAAAGRYKTLEHGSPGSSSGPDATPGRLIPGSSPSSSVNQPSPLSYSTTWIAGGSNNTTPSSSFIATDKMVLDGLGLGGRGGEGDSDEKMRLSIENMKLSSQVAALERQVAVLMSLQTREMALQAASNTTSTASRASASASLKRGDPRGDLQALMTTAAALSRGGAGSNTSSPSNGHQQVLSSAIPGASISASMSSPVRRQGASMSASSGPGEASTPPLYPDPPSPLPSSPHQVLQSNPGTVIKGLPSPSYR